MSPKVTPKKSIKKPVKPVQKPVKAKPAATGLVSHWLQDVSLEVVQPLSTFVPGQRELEFIVNATQVNIPHPTHGKLELRLRAHVVTSEGPLVVAEILYSGVVDKTQSEPSVAELFEELYQPARRSLEQVLVLSGHTPPLPEELKSALPRA